MTTTKIKLSMIVMALAITSLSAQEVARDERKTKFSIEIDPATFVFKGYSAHLRIQPKEYDHLLFGAGIYAMDMPSVFVNFNEKNRDKGWEVRLNQGVGLFGEHHFSEVNKKWFVGTQVSIQEYQIENENFGGSSKFTNTLFMGYGGYTLHPFDFPLYFKAWAGVGYSSKISGISTLEGQEYDISPITMFATLHVGYTFKNWVETKK